MKEYSLAVISPAKEETYRSTDKDHVMEQLAGLLKYHYIYHSPTILRVQRTTDYRTETITFYMRDKYKYVFKTPIF